MSICLILLASLIYSSAAPAFAEDRSSGRSGEDKEAKADPLDTDPIFAVVSIADQRISIYGSGGLLARSRVSTGKRGHATPTGVFSIVQKRRYHTSNIYSGAPMPFMQRITWSGIALHAGYVPGHPASHGCIRMPPSFAQRLFRATGVGQRVIIAPSDAEPMEMTHANLPAPQMTPVPGFASKDTAEIPDGIVSAGIAERSDGAVLEEASLQTPAVAEQRLNPIDFARAMRSKANRDAKSAAKATRSAKLQIGKKTSELRIASRKLSNAEGEVKSATRDLDKVLRRFEYEDGKEAIAEAAEVKAEAETALAEALKAKEARVAKATEARSAAEAGLAEARKAAEHLRMARAADTESQGEASLNEAEKASERRLAEASEAMSEAEAELAKVLKTEEEHVAEAIEFKQHAEAELAEARQVEEQRIARATEAKAEAEEALAEAQKSLAEARAAKGEKQAELDVARKEMAEAKSVGVAASKASSEATRRLKPLSVFISRKTKRLYVRQNFQQVFDEPVTIRDADREIGTHVFVSTRAAEDGSQLYWHAVSMPAAEERTARKSKRKKGDEEKAEEAAPVAEAETPQGALDRIIIPDDVSRRLAELAWVGASVIISDQGISGETGSTTDFIILTK